jgi:hypothetical protein
VRVAPSLRGAKLEKAEKHANISCPIDLFPKQEVEIAQLTHSINEAPTAAQKGPFAQSLVEAVTVLLECSAYDEENMNCNLCRNFSELRCKTARLVVAAGRLDRSRERRA